ncbi:hypothetical protein H180DRAFT_05131, partial [Streptomyces sp. WMMB 322]
VEAAPDTSGTGPDRFPSPKSNTTDPVGVPPPGDTAETVAVNVTDSPTTDGSGAPTTAVDVPAAFTTCESTPDEPEKLALPPYVAVTVNGEPPTVAYACEMVATPPDNGTGAETLPSPKSKTTDPIGVPEPGDTAETVAVNVTDSPTTDGSGAPATAVDVPAAFTPCVSAPTDALKLALPPYVAVTVNGEPDVVA